MSPANLHLSLRSRQPDSLDKSTFHTVQHPAAWNPQQTALLLCDVWDRHWCIGASQRVDELAPVIDSVVRKAREMGIFILHSPSDTLSFYVGVPARKRAENAPYAAPPADVRSWCRLDPSKEPPLPIDDSDGGCDDEPPCVSGKAWTRQHPAIAIADEDAISDDGQEVYNLFQQRRIENVIVLGVHTNMCVLGRPFGIRRLVGLGKQVVLMRDLTDTMYNSRQAPYVSHFQGTDRVIEHIETYWCPTITSDQILGGKPFRFRDRLTARENF